MSVTTRLLTIAVAIGGMAIVYAPRAGASARTEEAGSCNMGTNGNHCCYCNQVAPNQICFMNSDSGSFASCTQTQCGSTLCSN